MKLGQVGARSYTSPLLKYYTLYGLLIVHSICAYESEFKREPNWYLDLSIIEWYFVGLVKPNMMKFVAKYS